MVVIMIGGAKGAGKDYLASKLLKELGETSNRVAFADPLKDTVAKTLDLSIEEVDSLKNNNDKIIVTKDRGSRIVKAFTMREIIQRLGTEALRTIVSDTLWIDLAKKYINSNPQLEYVVITDFRFEKEYYEMINDYEVVSIKVEGGKDGDSHTSENDLANFKFDIYIDNKDKGEIDLLPVLDLLTVMGDD